MTRLTNLSHIDFEELCRDISQIETGERFSAFGPGPDGGIDGRHSTSSGSFVLQCKHYASSTFASLKASIKKELPKLDTLKPSRYLFFTSQSLTPKKVEEIAQILGCHLKSVNDIFGVEDIEGFLKRNPDLEKSHMKLWLSSAAVLERILNSGLEEFSNTTKDDIFEELRVYAKNKSLDDAIKLLEQERILIVSGMPGVGKTTLAKMVSYHYLNEEWKFYAIKSLDEGFARIKDSEPTIFFFDDFLGRVELNRQALHDQESALASFVKRVRKSTNARFILTTRAHIFEEARQVSDYVDDKKLQLSKYILDVGGYSRKIKAHILFNHLFVSDLSNEHFEALLEGEWLQQIVDHKNYNPRVIASISSECLDQVKPNDYPEYVVKALNNPEQIWEKPYRALSMRCQNLLTAIFFGSEYGETLDVVETNFSEFNRQICAHYGQSTRPNDFEDALKSLESGFITISGKTVSFINPSVRDFLSSQLRSEDFLRHLPATCRRADWARNLWRHLKFVFKNDSAALIRCALMFEEYCQFIGETSTIKRHSKGNGISISKNDLTIPERFEMVMDWWFVTKREHFVEVGINVLHSNVGDLGFWGEGRDLPEAHHWVCEYLDDTHPKKDAILHQIEFLLLSVLDTGVSSDEIVSTFDAVREYMSDTLNPKIEQSLQQLVEFEFDDVDQIIQDFTKSQLEEHLDFIDELAAKTGRSSELAKQSIVDRIIELEDMSSEYSGPSFLGTRKPMNEEFSDQELKSLMGNLVKEK